MVYQCSGGSAGVRPEENRTVHPTKWVEGRQVRVLRKSAQTATQNATRLRPDDEELAAVCAAWPTLPEPIKAAIMALVRAAGRATP